MKQWTKMTNQLDRGLKHVKMEQPTQKQGEHKLVYFDIM